MRSGASQSAREHWAHVHSSLISWHQSGFKDHHLLEETIHTLNNWLSAYPAQAADIQKIAISTCYTTSLLSLADSTAQIAQVGLDAALIRPLTSEEDQVSAILLALLAAEAHLEQSSAYEGQKLLDYAEYGIKLLELSRPMYAYLSLRQHNLRGVFAEAVLEMEVASACYHQAVQAAESLLQVDADFQALAQRWILCVFGNSPDLVENGVEQSLSLLRHDLDCTFRRAALGYARTAMQGAGEAALLAVDVCRRFGLPPDRSPFDLRRAILHVPLEELNSCVEDMAALAERFENPHLTAAWKVMLHSARMVRWRDISQKEMAHAVAACSKEMGNCFDTLIFALCLGDTMTERLHALKYPEDEGLISAFLLAYNQTLSQIQDLPLYLPIKACFDAPIASAIEWAFEAYRSYPSAETGGLLSVLLDSFHFQEHEAVPHHPETGSVEEGFAYALNRVERLAYAIAQMEDTAAIVLQSVGDEVLFLCATGREETPLLLERAGPDYRISARELALALRHDIEKPDPAGSKRLKELGMAALKAMPSNVQTLMAQRSTLLFAPDFRSEQDGVPFELFHDDSQFLGLSKNIARFLSLRELLRVVEPSVLSSLHTKRALCLAVPRAKGFPELVYADWEVEDIRASLIQEGWEIPDIAESELDTELLLEASELASVIHIAAHGDIFAGGEALVLPGDRRLMTREIERKPQFLKAFVFLNTCSLGQSRYLGGGVSRGIAYALVRGHAPCVIANLLPVYDRSASLLSIEFYDQAKHMAVGEALRQARARLNEQGGTPAHWASTILIGNPLYRFPEDAEEAAREESDSVSHLLRTYTSFDATNEELDAASREAATEALTHPNHLRLKSAFIWLEQAATIVPGQSFKPDTADKLARLAREIGHPSGEALMRFTLVQQMDAKSPLPEKLQTLDAAIRAIEPLSSHSESWDRLLRECLANHQRLSVPREPEAIHLASGVSVNDQSDSAIRAIFTMQHSLDQQQVRRRGRLDVRQPEDSLEDFAWNAIVQGRQNRFTDWIAHIEFASLLAQKLIRSGLIAPEAEAHTRRITAGLLPYLWSTQRTTHLEREIARGQSNILRLALESIIENWTPPETSPAFSRVAPFADTIEHWIQKREQAGLSKYARVLRALKSDDADPEGWESLLTSFRQPLEYCVGQSPQCGADGAAWILGLLLEKSHAFLQHSNTRGEAASDLLQIHEALNKNAESWFDPYLFEGYRNVDSEQRFFLVQWRVNMNAPDRGD